MIYDPFKGDKIQTYGGVRVWIIAAVILLYKILVELYAFTGDISFPIQNPPLAFANLTLSLTTGMVEEIIFRGLALVAMISAWGSTKQGQVKAVLLSSVFFGIIHMFNILVRPVGVVFIQAVVLVLPGILYSALVLTHRSLWPAIVIHGLTNAVVNIKLIGRENFQENLMMWIIFGLAMIPVIAYSAYLIWKLPEPYTYEIEEASS